VYFLCILRILYFVLWTIVILCAFDTRFIKCNLLACIEAPFRCWQNHDVELLSYAGSGSVVVSLVH